MATKPKAFAKEDLTTWERVKRAFANDWEQTKADFGVENARDMGQDVDDTLKQAVGSDDAFENHEQAFRFGYLAQARYGADNPTWNETLESTLRTDYEGDYDADREYIRHAYGYKSKA